MEEANEITADNNNQTFMNVITQPIVRITQAMIFNPMKVIIYGKSNLYIKI